MFGVGVAVVGVCFLTGVFWVALSSLVFVLCCVVLYNFVLYCFVEFCLLLFVLFLLFCLVVYKRVCFLSFYILRLSCVVLCCTSSIDWMLGVIVFYCVVSGLC